MTRGGDVATGGKENLPVARVSYIVWRTDQGRVHRKTLDLGVKRGQY